MTTQTQQTREEWLRGLQKDDEVAVTGDWRIYRIRPVTHTTRTQIHADGVKFNRDAGSSIGSSTWYRKNIVQPTAEIRAKVEESEILDWFLYRDWKKVPATVRKAMHAVYTAALQVEEAKQEEP